MLPAAPPAFGATLEGLCAPRVARAKPGRRERLGGGVRRTGGRGAPEPRSRAPWSAAEELQPPTGSQASLTCYLPCLVPEDPASRLIQEAQAKADQPGVLNANSATG